MQTLWQANFALCSRALVNLRVPALVALCACLSISYPATVAHAQPRAGGMPNPKDISGRPLPSPSLPVGTVTILVAKESLANPLPNVDVVGIVQDPGGDSRKRSAKTNGEGRAVFETLPAGSRFHAEANVGNETLKTDTFTVPASGGVRLMLVAGVGATSRDADKPGTAGAPEDAEGQGDAAPGFTLGIIAGTALMDAQLPVGTIEVSARDAQGTLLPNQVIELGVVGAGGQIEVKRQTTDKQGQTRFADAGKPTAPPSETKPSPTAGAPHGVAAAVAMSVGSLRVGTDGFSIPDAGGVRVELRVPDRTNDPSVVTVGEGGRIILQLRDDVLGFVESLPLQNHSEKIFDPGVGGIEVPLPSESTNAEGAEGEHKIEIRKGIGVAIHGVIPPRRATSVDPAQKSPDEVTFGFVLPLRGSTLDFEQRFPNGMGEFTFVSEQIAGLGIESPQITRRIDRDANGKKFWLWRGEPISPGGVLRFRVTGLPAVSNTGKVISAALALGLLLAAIVFSRKPSSTSAASRAGERERLIARREKLFSELLAHESNDSASKTAATKDASVSARKELVRKLENVYRELATLDEQRES